MCKTPELAARVTLLPLEKIKVDAAIIFADILLPLEPMGINLEFSKGEGPVIHNPPRTTAAIKKLKPVEPEHDLSFVMDAIRVVRRDLPSTIPLIGFSGAPFTLASYLIEGGGTRTFVRTKSLMYRDPTSWHILLERLSTVILDYLNAQIEAGAQAVQLFDSWAGVLSPADYGEFVLPYSQRIFSGLAEPVPAIHFATGTGGLLRSMRDAGGDIIGVDWRVDLATAWETIGFDVGIQGNLDPVVLLGPPDTIEKQVQRILTAAGGKPGHIFNLGHGVLPQTPEDHVATMVDVVHRLSRRV